MKKLFPLLLFFSFLTNLEAQYQDRYWIFGRTFDPLNTTNISFDFYPQFPNLYNPSTIPPAIDPPPINIEGSDGFEGWAVVTNPASGELVFYTDGNRVFDASHNDITPLGALGAHASSSQPVATCIEPICPFDKYYIFSNPTGIASNVTTPVPGPVTYRLFNSTDTTFSPIQNMPGPFANDIVGEGMLIIPSKSSPLTFWLITRLRDPISGQPSIYVIYKIDPTGVSFANSVQFGPSIPAATIMNITYRDISSSSDEVLVGLSASRSSSSAINTVFTRRFNSTTGEFVGPTNTIATFTDGNTLYDLEFSPNGAFLYYATYFSSLLYQAPIDPMTGALTSPPVLMNNFGSLRGGGLKLGPDGFIYHSADAGSINNRGIVRIGRIVQPNIPSTGSGNFNAMYEPDIIISPNTFSYGFPEFVNIPDWDALGYNPFQFAGLGEDQTLCEGEVLTLNANIGSANYLWQDNSTNSIFTVTQPGTYWVTVEIDGCERRDTIEVNYVAAPQVDLGPDTTLCAGDILTLDASTPGATYLWQDNSTAAILAVNMPGIYWAEVNVGDCQIRDTIIVDFSTTVPSNLLGADLIPCEGESILLDATTPNANYLWQDNSTNSSLTVTQSGTYWVLIDINGCEIRDTIEINFLTPPQIDLGEDTLVCPGETFTVDATTIGATYLWQDGSTDPTFEVRTAGIYFVSIQIGDCVVSDTIIVDYQLINFASLGNDTAFCEGASLLLDATTTDATYLWQDNSTDADLNVSIPGIYWVEINVDNCDFTDSIIVQEIPTPMINLGPDILLCPDEIWTLDASLPDATYLWQDSSAGSSLTITEAGLYWVEIAVDGCSNQDSILVNQSPLVFISLGPDTSVCSDEELTLSALTPNATYLWQDNSTRPIFNVTEPGIYTVEVSVDPCLFRDTITVVQGFETCNCFIYLPNIFTPNLDGINDVFHPYIECPLEEYELQIFNRWGGEVFESTNPELGWDGKTDEEDCQTGVYTFVLKYRFVGQGQLQIEGGDITLMR